MQRDPAIEAFRRLLSDAQGGGQAKVDALVALTQRTIFVGLWPGENAGMRTLTSSSGVAALPVFSDHVELEEAARRFAWMMPDGTIPSREVGSREALTHAMAHNLLVVVDIASPHSIEIDASEITPLISAQARRDSTGPFAASGRLGSSLMRAVKSSQPATEGMRTSTVPIPPPSNVPADAIERASRSIPAEAPDRSSKPAPPAATKSAPAPSPATSMKSAPAPIAPSSPSVQGNPPAPLPMPARSASVQLAAAQVNRSGIQLQHMGAPPSDDLLEQLSNVLRGYPEVEWACLAMVARNGAAAVPTVAIRVDPSFRTRVNDIMVAVREAGAKGHAALDVMLLDDPALIRFARSDGTMFYPWRR